LELILELLAVKGPALTQQQRLVLVWELAVGKLLDLEEHLAQAELVQ
jgi:hypothetical protein